MTAPVAESDNKSATINIRVDPQDLSLIDEAASLRGQSRSTFVIQAAYREAEDAFLDHRVFILSEEQWEAFNEALDAPPSENEKFLDMMACKAPWE